MRPSLDIDLVQRCAFDEAGHRQQTVAVGVDDRRRDTDRGSKLDGLALHLPVDAVMRQILPMRAKKERLPSWTVPGCGSCRP